MAIFAPVCTKVAELVYVFISLRNPRRLIKQAKLKAAGHQSSYILQDVAFKRRGGTFFR